MTLAARYKRNRRPGDAALRASLVAIVGAWSLASAGVRAATLDKASVPERVSFNRMGEYGVKVEEVVACGGIAEKNPLVMQIYADVCNRPMKISRSPQTCALGAAIFAAVVGGAHASVEAAQHAMTGVRDTVYAPNPANVAIYARLYEIYMTLHDAFGKIGGATSLHGVMKQLIAIRNEVRQSIH